MEPARENVSPEPSKGGVAATTSKSQLSSESMFKLEEQLSVEQFSHLMSHFQGPRQPVTMATDTFRQLLAQIMQRAPHDERITRLCTKIDASGEGVIGKEEFSSYLLQQLRERDNVSHVQHLPFQEPPRFKHCLVSKATIIRLLFSPAPPKYITISKDGGVGIWSTSLHFQRGFHLQGGLDSVGKPSALCVNDACLLQDCNRLALATTSREILFYDASTTVFSCQYRVHDFPAMVLCLTYHTGSQGSPSHFLYGDMQGTVTVLTFTSPSVGLFGAGPPDEDTQPVMIAFSRLSEHAQFVIVQSVPRLHPDWVRRVSYTPHNHSLISCSNSPAHSLVMRDVDRKRRGYVFRLRKGVLCYDYCQQLELVVTGSIDHNVRVWNSYVTSKPVAVLTAHSAAVIDVLVSTERGLIFTYSHDAVLCAWDLYEQLLVQKVHIRFPFSQRLPDYGPLVLSLSPAHLANPGLLITCNEFITELKLGATSLTPQGGLVESSHTHPLSAALYNPHLHQVVSGCEGGLVIVWDADSGHQVLRLNSCHGNNEITALTLDSAGRRVISGSRAGDLKVWNVGDGELLKRMGSAGYSEVTGVTHILERGQFLSVGWDKRITTFPDSQDVFDVKANRSFSSEGPHHCDDILCLSYCPPYYLATGSFDGQIKIWNVDLEKVVSQFHSITKPKPIPLPRMRKSSAASQLTASRSSMAQSSTHSSRPPSRRMATYRLRSALVPQLAHVPVVQLLFLRSRLRGHSKGSANLLTAEGPCVVFRDIFSQDEELQGCIQVTDNSEESVLALKTTPTDHTLVVGDSAGWIKVYDISNYCTPLHREKGPPLPVNSWRAHSGEVVSLDFVTQGSGHMILSASCDCTVRLWTEGGHYIGMFGQSKSWNLKNPSTFQHPNTPWGEVSRPNSHLSNSAPHEEAPVIKSNTNSQTHTQSSNQISASLSSSTSSLGNGALAEPLTDKSLGCNYDNSITRRMAGRHERRNVYSEIDNKSVQRFGSLCSPFQALQLLQLEETSLGRLAPT